MPGSPTLILRLRSALTALAIGACLSLGGAGIAFAQENGDQQELPDPDAPAQENGNGAGDDAPAEEAADDALPETGASALPLLVSGLLLLSAGGVLRPVVRRRRLGHDEWLEAVRSRRR